MFLLNENNINTAILKTNFKYKVFDKHDFPHLNSSFSKMLDNLLINRKFKLMNNTNLEVKKSIGILETIGFLAPNYTRKVKLKPFMYCLEGENYSIPMLVLYDEDFNHIICGYVVLMDNRYSIIVKMLGMNKKYSKGIIKDVSLAVNKSLQ